MRRLIIVCFVLINTVLQNGIHAQEYDFSTVSPSGHTLYYRLTHNDTQVVVFAKDKPQGKLYIPDTVEYFGKKFHVKGIAYGAFSNCTMLSSVRLPNTLHTIGNSAFSGCKSLKSIEIPSGVWEIKSNAFKNCTSLTAVTIPPNVGWIEYYAFMRCSSLTKVRILTCGHVASNVFDGCNGIEELYLNQYVKMPMWNVKKLILGDEFTQLPNDGDFQNLPKLEEVIIGNGLTQIQHDWFNNCENLRVVTIGTKVRSIYSNAFRKCISLDTIYALPALAPSINESSFLFTKPTKVVVTKCESDYADKWGTTEFQYHTEGIHTLSVYSSCESCGKAIIRKDVDCGNTAIIEAVPFEKYVFKQWSDGNTENPRSITLDRDIELKAEFARTIYDVIASSSNPIMGKVKGEGSYSLGETVTLTAYAECGFRFSGWSNGSVSNPISVRLTNDTNLTAYFEVAIDTVYIPDTTLEKIIVYDTTIIPVMLRDTNYIEVKVFDTICSFVYQFDSIFNNGNETLHTSANDLLVFQDTIYIYDTVTTGDGEEWKIRAKVYASDEFVVVEGVKKEDVILYNNCNQTNAIQANEKNDMVLYDVLVPGIYLIKIGNHLAKRIVVIK